MSQLIIQNDDGTTSEVQIFPGMEFTPDDLNGGVVIFKSDKVQIGQTYFSVASPAGIMACITANDNGVVKIQGTIKVRLSSINDDSLIPLECAEITSPTTDALAARIEALENA